MTEAERSETAAVVSISTPSSTTATNQFINQNEIDIVKTKIEECVSNESIGGVVEPPEVGDRCMATWRDGTYKLASIVERRSRDYRKRGRSSSLNMMHNSMTASKRASPDTLVSLNQTTSTTALKAYNNATAMSCPLSVLSASQIEYYVHYLNHDRRLDEWISLSKLDLSTLDTSHRPVSPDGTHCRRTRGKKRPSSPTGGSNTAAPSADQSLAALEHEHEEITKVKNISNIILGKYQVEAWYFSPYPEEYSNEDTLYVCEFCLKYMKKHKTLLRHKAECSMCTPPGTEIYRESNLSVFEVDGKEHRIYCQNLCLLAKLFLDHKTLYYDVEPFWFYIIAQVDEKGAHIVGYFSKEKVSAEDYNLACILTFPQYQKMGYGKFIISLSYELSKREKKAGSPEKPLSDLGKISYRSYWTYVLMSLLHQHPNKKILSMKDISNLTAIKIEDIISTLQSLNMVKSWKGQHVVYVQWNAVQEYFMNRREIRTCKSDCLTWEPRAK